MWLAFFGALSAMTGTALATSSGTVSDPSLLQALAVATTVTETATLSGPFNADGFMHSYGGGDLEQLVAAPTDDDADDNEELEFAQASREVRRKFNSETTRWGLYAVAQNLNAEMKEEFRFSRKSLPIFLCYSGEAENRLYKSHGRFAAHMEYQRRDLCLFLSCNFVFCDANADGAVEPFMQLQSRLYTFVLQLLNEDIRDAEYRLKMGGMNAERTEHYAGVFKDYKALKETLLHQLEVPPDFVPLMMNMLRQMITDKPQLQLRGKNFPADFRLSAYLTSLGGEFRRTLLQAYAPEYSTSDAYNRFCENFLLSATRTIDAIYDDSAERAFLHWLEIVRTGIATIYFEAEKERNWQLNTAIVLVYKSFPGVIEQPELNRHKKLFQPQAKELVKAFQAWPEGVPLYGFIKLAFQVFVSVLEPKGYSGVYSPDQAAAILTIRYNLSSTGLGNTLGKIAGRFSPKKKAKKIS